MPRHTLTATTTHTLATGHQVRVELKVEGPYRDAGDDFQQHWIPDDASNREVLERVKASAVAALKEFS